MIEPVVRLLASPIWNDELHLHFAIRDTATGNITIAQPAPMVMQTEAERRASLGMVTLPDPALRIPIREGNALQQIMQQLWDMGVRPNGINSLGADNAQKHHLEDMRAIVAQQLRVSMPGRGMKAEF